MLLSNHEQLVRLFYCLGFGGVLCLYDSLFACWRRIAKRAPLRLFILDVILCVTGGGGFFIFSLAISGGELQAIMLLAVALGFAAMRTTRRYVRHLLIVPLTRILTPVACAICHFCAAAREKMRIVSKKVAIFLKKGLHRIYNVVYNVFTHK